MNYRKLRIAWSVGWCVACVIVVVYWVRSYSVNEVWAFYAGGKRYGFQSVCGRVNISWSTPNKGQRDTLWKQPVTDGLRQIAHNRENRLGFAYRYTPDPGSLRIKLPSWFLLTAAMASAALPWVTVLPWARWHFSLRTLLIAMTLVALVLGLVIWAAK